MLVLTKLLATKPFLHHPVHIQCTCTGISDPLPSLFFPFLSFLLPVTPPPSPFFLPSPLLPLPPPSIPRLQSFAASVRSVAELGCYR